MLDQARKALGQALHTIQDFYSHSNWVENNANIFPGLGTLDGAPPGGVASGPTCSACATYTGCSNNLIAYNWTSGYFNSVLLLGRGAPSLLASAVTAALLI